MAVVLPLIAIAGGAATVAGVVGTAITVASVVTAVAGVASIVSGVASLAGNTKVAKIAGIIGLAAGAYSMVAGGAGAASGGELMGPPESAAGGSYIENTLAAERGIANAPDVSGGSAPSIAEANAAPTPMAEATPVPTAGMEPPTALPEAGGGTSSTPGSGSLLNETALADAYGPGSSMMDGSAGAIRGPMTSTSPVQNSFLDSLKNVGKVMKDNKELVQMAGGAAEGMWGPQAKRMNLYEQEIEMQKRELARQNANANNLVGLRLPLIYNPNQPPLRRPGS